MGTHERERRIGDRDVRVWGGTEAPAPGRWWIDGAGSRLIFVVRYRQTRRLRGRFVDIAGAVDIGERPEDSALEARIGAASIRTGVRVLDRILRSRRLLNVGRYPDLRFRSTEVAVDGQQHLRVDGDLTVRGITRPVTLDVEYAGSEEHARGTVATFRARGQLDRSEFGLGWRSILGVPVSGRAVLIDLRVSLTRERP